MKLRITQKGFENYTGQMGVIHFEDGVSRDDVLEVDAVRVSAVMMAEWIDGTVSSVSQRYLDNMKTPAPDVSMTGIVTVGAAAQTPSQASAVATHTEEQLAAIADKDGIAGLRLIADPLNIKGNSIRGLIDAILKTVGTSAPVVAADAAVVVEAGPADAAVVETVAAETLVEADAATEAE